MIRFIILFLFLSTSLSSTAQVWYGTDIYTTNIHGIDSNGDSTGFVHIDCLIFPNGDTVCGGLDSASLYTLLNSKLDSVSKSNDTVYYYRNGVRAFAIIDSDAIPTLLQVDGVIDLKKDYGADSTRTVSISTVTRQAFATGRAIYLGEGDFLIDSTVNVPDSAVIYGEGWKTKIWVANNVKAFSVGNFARIENITFMGTRGSGGTTSQIAISLDTSRGQLIRGCNFYKIAGSAIKITQTNVTTFQGSQIQNCYSDSCYIGIFVANRGEYANIDNCTFINGRYGAYIKGGNTPFSGGKFTGNFYGIYINGNEDGNEAHSSITGATSNHNTHNVYVDSIRYGHLFTGCDFYYGGISVRNSNGVRFNGCDIGFQGSLDTFAVVNSTNTSFDNIAFYNAQEPLRISDGSPFPVSDYSGVTKRFYNLNSDSTSIKLQAWGGIEAKGGIFRQYGRSTASIRGIIASQYTTDANAASFVGTKARGAEGAETVITSGDTIFQVRGMAYDGANFVRAGGISMRSTGTIGALRVPSEMIFMTATNAAPSVPTVAMTIDNAQLVNIGTTLGLAARLGIKSNGINDVQRWEYSGNAGAIFRISIDGQFSWGASGNTVSFYEAAAAGSPAGATGGGMSAFRLNNTSNIISTNAAGFGFLQGANWANTTGVTNTTGNINFMRYRFNVSPTSGTAEFNHALFDGVINQTGTATGVTRGIYINITRTSAADFRALEVVTGKSIFRDSALFTLMPLRTSEIDTLVVGGPGGILQKVKNPLADGTFTPTLSNVANISSSTAHNCIYSKNDSTITISGKIEFTTTTGGGTLTRLGISLPFASNFTADDDCSGTAFDFNDLEGAVIISDATNDRMELTYHDDSAATHIMRFTCQYRIK